MALVAVASRAKVPPSAIVALNTASVAALPLTVVLGVIRVLVRAHKPLNQMFNFYHIYFHKSSIKSIYNPLIIIYMLLS